MEWPALTLKNARVSENADKEVLGDGRGSAMTHGREFQVVNAGSVQPNQRNGIRRGKNLRDRGSASCAALNDLARGAGKIAFRSRNRLTCGIVDSQGIGRPQRVAVPVEHCDSQQVNL